jgi:hypothetical protein
LDLQTYKQVINMNRKVYLMSLIISCPLNDPVESCPFNKFRDISILKLIEKTNSLSPEEVLLLANEHKMCLRKRERALKKNRLLVQKRA